MKITVRGIWAVFGFIAALVLILGFPIAEPYVEYIALADAVVIVTLVGQIKRHIPDSPLFFFNITYFLFVLGGGTVVILTGASISDYTGVSTEAATQGCLIALVGIAIIDLVYLLIDGNRRTNKSSDRALKSKIKSANGYQTQVTVWIFILSAICKLMMAIETAVYSLSFGYTALFVRESSSLPSIIQYIGSLFYFSLMLALMCNFRKKITYCIFAFVMALETIILASGDRAEAVCGFMIIIIYTMQRLKRERDFFKSKKIFVAAMIACLPVGMYGLQAIKLLRNGYENTMGLWEGVVEFLQAQGASLNILGHCVEMRERISFVAGNHFTIGHLLAYFQQNALVRGIFGIARIRTNTVEAATNGYSYGSTMAYLRYPTSYLAGTGCGTCYLAELFHDYSWVGVILGSIFVAYLLYKMNGIGFSSWISNAIYLNCMRMILLMPRGAFFKWLTSSFAVPNLMLIALLVIPPMLRPAASLDKESS